VRNKAFKCVKGLNKWLPNLVLVVFFPILSYAQPGAVCTLQAPDNPGGINSRMFALTLPKGEHLYLVGHIHGETADVMKLLDFFRDTDKDNAQFLARAKQRIEKLEITRDHFRDEQMLLRHLAQNNRIKFIGTEADQEIASVYDTIARAFDSEAKRVLRARKIARPDFLEDTRLVLLGAPRYAKKMYPKLLGTTPLIAIENQELLTKEVETREQANDAIFALLKTQIDEAELQKVGWAFIQIFFRYAEMENLTDEQIIAEFNAVFPEHLREPLAPYISQMKDAVRLINQRDDKNAENLLAAVKKYKGGGVHFIGMAHYQSMAIKLVRACQSQFLGSHQMPQPSRQLSPEATR